jgi:hypothetical protein
MEERRIQGGSGGGGGKWANGFGGQNPNPNLPPFPALLPNPPKISSRKSKKKRWQFEGRERRKNPLDLGGHSQHYTALHLHYDGQRKPKIGICDVREMNKGGKSNEDERGR